MFVGVMNFGQIQKIRFVVVKKFCSNSNQFLVILIWSSDLALVGCAFWGRRLMTKHQQLNPKRQDFQFH